MKKLTQKNIFNIIIGIIVILLIVLLISLALGKTKNKPTKVNLPELESSEFTYNGVEQKVKLKDESDLNTAYTLSGDEKATNAGEYTITLTLKSNYIWKDKSSDPIDLTWKINKKSITVKANDAEMVEGDSLPRLTYSTEGLVSGDKLNGTLKVDGALTKGTYDIVQGDDWANRNYNITFLKGTLTVAEGPAYTLVDAPTFDELEYNGEDQSYALTDSTLLDVAYTISGDLTGFNAGTYNVTLTLLDGYAWKDESTSPINLTWSINYKEATIKAQNRYKDEGEDDPNFGVSIIGVLDRDREDITYTSLYREEGETVGDYYIIVTGNEIQGNYHVTFVNGVFTIEEKELERIEEPVFFDLTYNGENQTPELYDDEYLDVAYTLSGILSAKNVGDYLVTATLLDGYAWSDGSTEPLTISWVIDYKEAYVIACDALKHAGEMDPEFHVQIEGAENGEEDLITYTSIYREEGEDEGVYSIIVIGDLIQGNYRVSFEEGIFIIEPSLDI